MVAQIFGWGYLQSVFSKVLRIVQSVHEVVLVFPHLKVHDGAGRLAPGTVHHLPGGGPHEVVLNLEEEAEGGGGGADGGVRLEERGKCF